jgi:methyl-accepting chemotaxis protein
MKISLSRFALRTQICAIAAIGVVALIGVGGVVALTASIEDRRRQEMELVTASNTAVGAAGYALEASRTQSNMFIAQKQSTLIDKRQSLLNEADANLVKLLKPSLPVDVQSNVRKSRDLLKIYDSQFSNIVSIIRDLGFTETEGLQGSLRKSVHEVEDRLANFGKQDLDPLILAQLNVRMLMMRRHEKDFMLRGDAKYLPEMKLRAAEFAAVLNDATLPADEKASIAGNLSAYQADFANFAAASLSLPNAVEQLRATESQLSSLTAETISSLERARTAKTKEAAASSSTILWFEAISIAVISVMMAVFGLIVGSVIARRIVGLAATMKALASGNHDVTVPGKDSRDEIGHMARAVTVFKTNITESKRLAAEQEAARAARSHRQDAMDHHTRVFGSSVTGVMAALGTAAGNMRRAAGVMADSASAVHHQASDTAGDAGQSAADLTAIAAAVEQFTASVSEIARQVAVASEVTAQAVQRAEASKATIRGLADSTARIGDVVRLIDSIAGQTNLLALNATIEAARAGDAGKGFAVVAGEVKALAAQTAKATAEIGAQIETVRGATEDTVAAMNEIGGIIGRMGEASTAISAAVEEQSITTREIASSIQGVAGSTARAAQAMQNVVQVADRAGDASRNILSEATEIGSESEKLRHEVEKFLSAVQNVSG